MKIFRSALDNQKQKWKESKREKEKLESYQEGEQINEAENIRKDAKRLAVLKQYETAIAEFEKALHLYPVKDPSLTGSQDDIMMKDVNVFYFKCYYNMALCHAYLGDPNKSIHLYDKCLCLSLDDNSKIMALLGKGNEVSKKRNMLTEKGDTMTKVHKELVSAAYECFSQVVELDKKNADAWYQKGYHEFLIGQIKDAVNSFDDVLKLNKRYDNKAGIPLFDSMKREKGIKVKTTYEKEESPGDYFFKTKSGHMVRSRAEMMIANFLFDNNLLFQYEPAAPWADSKDFRPSFYIPKFDLYMEHYGHNKVKEYRKMMQSRIKEFEKNKKRFVFTVSEDERAMEDSLKMKLKSYISL